MYSKLIQDEVDRYERMINGAKARDHHARMAERLVGEFPEGHYHSSALTGVQVSYHLDNARQLERMLLWLRGFGYRSDKGEDKPAEKRRSFFINKRDSTLSTFMKTAYPEIRIDAYFLNDDATCRYVEVGKKTIPAVEAREVPVYELQCDEVPA